MRMELNIAVLIKLGQTLILTRENPV